MHGDRARDYAVNLGVALQLTNILRDVAADLERGRIYLPLDDLARFGCTEDDLGAGRVSRPVRELLAFEAVARSATSTGARPRRRPDGEGRRLVAAEIMARRSIAICSRASNARGYDVFSSRIRVPRPRQAWHRAWRLGRTQLGLDGRA